MFQCFFLLVLSYMIMSLRLGDIIKIGESDLFLYLGEELEPWAETVISGIDSKENFKNISNGIKFIETEEFEHGHEEHDGHDEHEKYDTHIWLDPTKAAVMVQNIAENLSEMDSNNNSYYMQRASDYIQKLLELDDNFKKTVSEGNRKVIAFGGPFSYAYFIKRYNLSYISAYDSCGESSEPSVDKIFSVIEKIKKDNLPVIFYKELSSGNIVKTISEETGAKSIEFNSLHSITKEQLENGDNYLKIMNRNLNGLIEALN